MLPQRVQALINEYAKPITRPDWRKGSACNDAFKYSDLNIYLHQIVIDWMGSSKTLNRLLENNNSFIEDFKIYKDDIYLVHRYNTERLVYDNYYFMLVNLSLLKKINSFYYIHIKDNSNHYYLNVNWALIVD
jgi:hypothetical protein